jgi:hypothetical protein
MIDREYRDQAARAVRRFLDCEIDNFDYENKYPRPSLFSKRRIEDHAIQSIEELTWNWYDDFSAHKLEGTHSLSLEMREVGERCVLFLASDTEYEWRERRFLGSGPMTSDLTTLNLNPTHLQLREQLAAHLDQPEGDASVWPFFRREDYEATRQTFVSTCR